MEKLKILIAMHKQYIFPLQRYYFPIGVGRALGNNIFLNISGDDTGDNISLKNSSFCELTALYWAWKNNFFKECLYVGLVHYRRYFKGKEIKLSNKRIASDNEILDYLKHSDCIVPKKRNYYIETIYEHYKHAHNIVDLDVTACILKEKYPDYMESFYTIMNSKELYLYNMFVMKKELFEQYCKWVFDVLFELEIRIDITKYDNYQKRVFGFIAERLFNVWLLKNNIIVKEISIINIEKERTFLKVVNFIKRKFLCGK